VRGAASAAAGLLALLAGCSCASGEGDELTVYAAASLTEAFEALETDARFNFAGSDELAFQIREGAPADVYAAASPRHPTELREEDLIEEPQVFATNTLVLIVPADNAAGIETVADVAEPGVKLVVGAEGVPVGDYTRAVLASLGETRALENIVSNEDDVKGVVSKVAQAEADAGFVYATDVAAVQGEVTAIELPEEAQVRIEYPIAVVSDAPNLAAAREFVDLVLSERGRDALREAGFGVP
jgi:molybdate transport system substrate-binding protein